MKYINLLLFAIMVVMNYLANALPLNNKTTGELSDMYPNLFVPAGITFSIWGVIYLLLLGFCIVQFTSRNQAVINSVSVLFALTCIFNSLWIAAWHYQRLPLSLIIMAGLLITLILINMKLAPTGNLFLKAAFGVYLGWICIATIANVTALLVNYNWNGFGLSEVAWTIIMISIGTVIASLSIMNFRNAFLGLAVIWAFAGIIINRQDDYKQIVIAAAVAIVIVAVVTLLGFIKPISQPGN